MSAVIEQPMVRVLGPLDVLTPAGAMPIRGHRQQTLLAALVVGIGHAVPTDHLAWALWGDELPDAAANTLQSSISQLRHVVGHDAIKVLGHAYELDPAIVDVDARRFERLARAAYVDRNEPATCLQTCRDALGLWRGRPFGDLADDEPFRLEAYRLDELRLDTVSISLEAELALGNHGLVAGELEALVREYPYRERLWRLLIEALLEGDRRVEALRSCSELRAVLGETGLSPGPWLPVLEREILEGTARPGEHDR